MVKYIVKNLSTSKQNVSTNVKLNPSHYHLTFMLQKKAKKKKLFKYGNFLIPRN